MKFDIKSRCLIEQKKYEFPEDKYYGESILIMNVVELLPVFFTFLY